MLEFRLCDCPNSGAARWRGAVRVRDRGAGVYDLVVFLAADDNDSASWGRAIEVASAREGIDAGCWRVTA